MRHIDSDLLMASFLQYEGGITSTDVLCIVPAAGGVSIDEISYRKNTTSFHVFHFPLSSRVGCADEVSTLNLSSSVEINNIT